MSTLEERIGKKAKAHHLLDRMTSDQAFAKRFGPGLLEHAKQYSCTGKYVLTLQKMSQTTLEPTFKQYITSQYQDVKDQLLACVGCSITYRR